MAVRDGNTNGFETRLGSKKGQGGLYVRSGRASQAAWIGLDAVAANGTRTTIYLWASSDGKIRTGTSIPADTETGGTVIGTQT